MRINIRSVKNFTEFSYNILGTNGRILAGQTIQVPSTKDYDFEFTPTHEMHSEIEIYAFFIIDDRELAFDSMQLQFVESNKNFVYG